MLIRYLKEIFSGTPSYRLASQSQALAFLEKFEVFPFIPSSYGLVLQGVRNSIKYQVSYWDGAILAAAVELGAKTLYSEDFTDGQLYGTVGVINPFSI
jgi:predicted nucleic acid-binding protein